MIDAVVLAGGRTNSALASISKTDYEAEINIAGHSMIEYVIDALNDTGLINNLVVIGPSTLSLNMKKHNNITLLPPENSMTANLQKGILALNQPGHVLVVTCDIPLITAEAITDFIKKCQTQDADIFYPVVSKKNNERKYPGVKRTYITLKEDVYTGGNIFLVKPEVVINCLPKLEQAIALRKKPFSLCRLLGFSFFIKLLFGQLSITEIENRIEQILNFKGKAIISSYPEIGVDVDKPSDLFLATRMLAKTAGKGLGDRV